MTLPELASYAQLFNILLLPAVVWIVKLERRLVGIASAVKSHGELDAEIHKGIRRDVARLEARIEGAA